MRSIRSLWLIVPFCGLAFFLWINAARLTRVETVMRTDAENAIVDPSSTTGYRDGKRWLIVPEHNNRSYQWIEETQQLFAQHRARLREVKNENAPTGRAVYSGSPYRWWIALVALAIHALQGGPIGLAVERAALWADPILDLVSLLGAFVFIARRWSPFPAACFFLGATALYPFAGGFLPGSPDVHGLGLLLSFWGLLFLLAGIFRPASEDAPPAWEIGAPARRFFALAGLAQGLALWVDATSQIPFLAGLFIGGLGCIFCRRKSDTGHVLPWRVWAASGFIVSLLGYLVENLPGPLGLHLEVNHPLYGLAWLGAAEILTVAETFRPRADQRSTLAAIARLSLGLVAIGAFAFFAQRAENPIFFATDEYSARLTFLANGVAAKNLAAWFARDGATLAVVSTLLPLVIALRALWLLFGSGVPSPLRSALALALGPALVAGALAVGQLRNWNTCDVALLSLLALLAAEAKRLRTRLATLSAALAALGPGIFQLIPPHSSAGNIEFTRLEVQGLLERQIAHWLADHADARDAVVLLPPERTVSWSFHGGFRGVGTANWENRDGLADTVKLATATTADRAFDLVTKHSINYIVLPSWDTDLDAFARWSLRNPEDAFVMALHHWALPPWLQAVPYRMPSVPGFENESVVILKVTEDANRVVALSRLADYFVESEQMGPAASLSELLEQYPADVNALVALAGIEKARGLTDEFAKTIETIAAAANAGSDRNLPWDRRVSLAIVLAQGGKTDLSRAEVQKCFAKINAPRIRSLSTGELYRLQVLAKAFGLKIDDDALRQLALDLLPGELRERL